MTPSSASPGSARPSCAMRHGIGDAAGLDHDRIETSADSSTWISAPVRSSPIWQHTQPLVSAMVSPRVRGDQLGVDVERAEVVDQHREPLACRVAQPEVEQRGLAGAEKAADHRQRHAWRAIPSCAGGASRRRPPSTVPAIAHVLQPLRRRSRRIVVEHAEVGELADFDRADAMIELQRVGRAERDRAQAPAPPRCARFAAEHVAGRGDAVDRAPRREQRCQRR